jgi:hypothetical protein
MMFSVRRVDVLPSSVVDADKADGFIYVCEQAALMFGSDRREPKAYRPVFRIRNDGPRAVVLPCTTKDSSDFPDFFELNDQRVWWTGPPNGRHSFAYYRCEVVAGDMLKNKIGTMAQPARIELLSWLKSRY